MTGANVVYRIDAQDRIVSTNPEWDRFALENAGENLVSERVRSESLWDYISDHTTRLLYRDLLKRVRSGHQANFPLRCDSPDLRRFLEMSMRLAEGDTVEFEVRTLRLEKRAAQPLLERGGERSDEFLRMCGWCKKMPYGAGWVEIEEAVAKLSLFESAELPLVSHGICEACETKMNSLPAV